MTESNAHVFSQSHLERVYRRNFFFFLTDSVLCTIAMGIIAPTTLIPDFIRRLTSSEILIGLSASPFDVGTGLTRQTLAFSKKFANHIGAIWFFFHRYNAAVSV
jgi:hypothetical protein